MNTPSPTHHQSRGRPMDKLPYAIMFNQALFTFAVLTFLPLGIVWVRTKDYMAGMTASTLCFSGIMAGIAVGIAIGKLSTQADLLRREERNARFQEQVDDQNRD